MQFIMTADLKPGMRIAKPIYNKQGVLLYERDTKLTRQGISSIENFGLIGIFILEPAEPVPPLSEEDIAFERFQTVYMFRLKENMDKITDGDSPDTLPALAQEIQKRYGVLDHKLNFTQNLRSSADFVYKHSISVAILCAMISNELRLNTSDQNALIVAALLYDFGYLYVPKAILDKGDNLSESDEDFIQMNLERGYEAIRPNYEVVDLPHASLEIIKQAVFQNSDTMKVKEPGKELRLLVDILRTADKFDRLTAMNINKPPMSEISAMLYLMKRPRIYNPSVVSALADSIHILPTGACVDLSDGEKALVLVENPEDFSRPMVLKFSNNMIYDLSDPAIGNSLRVKDIMKTMDNRIAVDEETLKQFVADDYLKKTTERFRKAKEEAAQHRQEEAAATKQRGGAVKKLREAAGKRLRGAASRAQSGNWQGADADADAANGAAGAAGAARATGANGANAANGAAGADAAAADAAAKPKAKRPSSAEAANAAAAAAAAAVAGSQVAPLSIDLKE